LFKKNNLPARLSGWIPYPFILLPAALAFLYVYSFGVNVVWEDEWATVALFNRLFSGELGMADLWAQHGDHRIFFPRIAALALGSITSFNSVAEMYLTLTCFLLTLIGLLLVFRDDVKSSLSLLLFVPVAFMVFSFRQYENMLSGFQIAFGLVQAFSVLALCSLYFSRYEKLRRFALPSALASATVGSFSAAQGLFVWPVGLLQLLIAPIEKPAKKVMVGVWGSIGLAEWVVYFIGFTKADQMPSWRYILEHPMVAVQYFLTSLGSALFSQQTFALLGGVLLVCLAIASLFLIYKDGRLGEYSFWIALLFFSFLTLASVTLGRSAYGVPQALQSKYTTFSMLAIIGAYVILVRLVLERRSYLTVGLLGTVSAVILLSVPLSYWEGIGQGKNIEASREELMFNLSTYESQPDEAFRDIPHEPNYIRKQLRSLDKRDYNVFSEP